MQILYMLTHVVSRLCISHIFSVKEGKGSIVRVLSSIELSSCTYLHARFT